MPDVNSSLPPVGPNAPSLPTPIFPSPSAVNNDLAGAEHAALAPHGKSPFKLKIVLPLLLALFVLFSSYLAYFVWMPRVQAKSFTTQSFEDFDKVLENIDSIKSNKTVFADNSQSFEISKGVFYEIAQLRNHTDAVVDTKRDMEDVKSILAKIGEARKSKGKFRVGSDVGKLNKAQDDYYDKLEEGMNRLYLYEDSQMKMLDAIGDVYSRELERMFAVYGTDKPREETLAYFNNLSTLCDETVEKLKKLANAPDDLADYYKLTLVSQEDMAAVLKNVAVSFSKANEEGDKNVLIDLTDFGRRQIDRNKQIQDNTLLLVKNSDTSKVFSEAISLEAKVKDEFKNTQAKLGITTQGQKQGESTGAAKLQ